MSGGLGVFVWEKRYTEKERGRDAKNKKELKIYIYIYFNEMIKNIKPFILRNLSIINIRF